MNMMSRVRGCSAFLCALGLAGGSLVAQAGAASFDASRADEPCGIVTAQMVASALEVPVDSFQQLHLMASRCAYKMKDKSTLLRVDFSVRASDTDKTAAEDFRRYTQSIPVGEIADGMKAARKQVEKKGAPGNDAKTGAVKEPRSSLQQRGIQFKDIHEIADQARLAASNGTLHFQQGNLLMKLSAFYGPVMPIPDEITQETMIKALTTWLQNTMAEREEQAIVLAKAALAAL